MGNAGQVAEELGTSVSRIKAINDAVPTDIYPKAYYGIQPEAGTARKSLGFDGGLPRLSANCQQKRHDVPNSLGSREAEEGIEPSNRGFADLGLTTWLPRHTL